MNATSTDELQSAAWGGGELRDPKGSQKLGPNPSHMHLPSRRENRKPEEHNPLPVPIKIVLVEAPSLDEHKIYTYI